MRRMLAETRMDRHILEGMAADMTTPRLSGPCTRGDHHYCLGPHMILPCNCTCHDKDAPTYTVEVKLNPKAMWLRLTLPTDDSKEAYRDAKQYAEKAQSEGRSTVEYRVVQTDADGAKIAQIVTPDGLGDLNPLNLLWIEKMEREDASNERT